MARTPNADAALQQAQGMLLRKPAFQREIGVLSRWETGINQKPRRPSSPTHATDWRWHGDDIHLAQVQAART